MVEFIEQDLDTSAEAELGFSCRLGREVFVGEDQVHTIVRSIEVAAEGYSSTEESFQPALSSSRSAARSIRKVDSSTSFDTAVGEGSSGFKLGEHSDVEGSDYMSGPDCRGAELSGDEGPRCGTPPVA